MAERKNWILAILLSSPIILFFLAHLFYHDPKLVPTGFIQYDNVTYAGNAIQYTWKEHQSLFYANRLNDSFTYPRIYFNPQLLILAGLIRIGMAPGLAMMLFTLLCAIVFFRIAIAVYDSLKKNDDYRTLSIVLLSWGGGLLCVSGFLLHVIGILKQDFWTSLFTLDPAYGWWGLNTGRSLFFSLEAWYHTLFFGIILCILKRKWVLVSLLLLTLSLSHPFTGIELLLILLAWAVLEFLVQRGSIPIWFIICIVCLLTLHISYYLVYLNKFPEHYAVFQQYSLNWRYRFYHFIPAYAITGFLFLLALKVEGIRKFFSNHYNRLLICWALVAFTLANHELFINPMQPIHFTRGYIWSALFFAGMPGLSYLWKFFSGRRGKIIYISAFTMLFLSDNILWIWKNSQRVNEVTLVTHISREQKQVLDFLSANTRYGDLIIGSDEVIPYLSSVRTKANIWTSHAYNTPAYLYKKNTFNKFIETGQWPVEWQRTATFFVVNRSNEQEVKIISNFSGSRKILQTGNYMVFLVQRTTAQVVQPAR